MKVRERLCVELGAAKPRWDAWCAHRGVTVGDGVRQLINAALSEGADDRPLASGGELYQPIVGDSRSRIEIRLTLAERFAVDESAAASGLNSNRWIVALIRAQLTREPQLGDREMRLLSASNMELAAISRSLGRLLREGPGATCGDRTDFPRVRETLDLHMRTVSRLIRANLDRWSR